MWKVDLWLIPWLCLLWVHLATATQASFTRYPPRLLHWLITPVSRYLLSFLDRTNIGNARLAGLETDLNMGGHDYNNALTIFFVRLP